MKTVSLTSAKTTSATLAARTVFPKTTSATLAARTVFPKTISTIKNRKATPCPLTS